MSTYQIVDTPFITAGSGNRWFVFRESDRAKVSGPHLTRGAAVTSTKAGPSAAALELNDIRRQIKQLQQERSNGGDRNIIRPALENLRNLEDAAWRKSEGLV